MRASAAPARKVAAAADSEGETGSWARLACAVSAALIVVAGPAHAVSGGSLGLGESGLPISNKVLLGGRGGGGRGAGWGENQSLVGQAALSASLDLAPKIWRGLPPVRFYAIINLNIDRMLGSLYRRQRR